MKTLPLFHFAIYAVTMAIRHPKSPVAYYYCGKCRTRLPASSKACPKCGDGVGHSPDPRQQSPVPWWGSVMVIVIGIVCWILGAGFEVPGLDEAGRALVYVPLGNLFGMSMRS